MAAERRTCPECKNLVPTYPNGKFYRHKCSGESGAAELPVEETPLEAKSVEDEPVEEERVSVPSSEISKPKCFSHTIRMRTPGVYVDADDPWHIPHKVLTERAAVEAGHTPDGEAVFRHCSQVGPRRYHLVYEIPVK